MNYIFCPSYEPLYFVLYLWNSGMEDITVITYSCSIERFCNHLGIKVIYFKMPEIVGKNPVEKFNNLRRYKKTVDAVIEKIIIREEDKYYFLGSIISYPAFYFAKIFSKKCTVYLWNINNYSKHYKIKKLRKYFDINYLKNRYYGYLIGFIFGFKLKLLCSGVDYDIALDEKFFRKYHVKRLKISHSLRDLRQDAILKHAKIVEEEYDTLIPYEYKIFFESFISMESMKKIYEYLFSILKNYVIKEHPPQSDKIKDNQKRRLFANCPVFADYIPIELLFKNIRKNVIGFTSTTLVSAAIFSNLKVISFLELVEWKDEEAKRVYKDFIQRQTDRVIFPRSFEELKSLLK